MSVIWEFLRGCQNLKQPLLEVLDELGKDDSVPPISCIVSDSILYFAQGVAESLGVPWIAYFPLPASSLLVQLSGAEGIPCFGFELELQAEMNPQRLGLRCNELPVFSWNGRESFLVDQINCLKQAKWVILNTSDVLESAELEAVRQRGLNRVLPVGPLQPVEFIHNRHRVTTRIPTAAMWCEEEELVLSWLASRPKSSVLYVSFGSIASVGLKDLEKLLDALVETKQWFLWVYREDMVDGDESMKREFMDRAQQSSRGIIVSWAPQLKVLRHPATGAFLSHCGWNSTFEAIVAGVPIIAWPCFADQGINAKYAVDVWRTGMKICPTGDMVNVVNEVMTGGLGCEMRRRAAILGGKCTGESYVQSQNNLKKIFERLE